MNFWTQIDPEDSLPSLPPLCYLCMYILKWTRPDVCKLSTVSMLWASGTVIEHANRIALGPFNNVLVFDCQAFGEDFVALDHQKTGNALYLHEKDVKVRSGPVRHPAEIRRQTTRLIYSRASVFLSFHPANEKGGSETTMLRILAYVLRPEVPLSPEEVESNSAAPTKLNIGGEGGFQLDKKSYKVHSTFTAWPTKANAEVLLIISDTAQLEKHHALVIMPTKDRISMPCPDLPEIVLQSVTSVIAHEAANKQRGLPVVGHKADCAPIVVIRTRRTSTCGRKSAG
eukprot:scaffold93085_cov33-Prasinocladus_malaysianus.AAC.2